MALSYLVTGQRLQSSPKNVLYGDKEEIIEQCVGEKIVKADAHFTRDITGFAIGGVPPVGHKQTITHIFIDEDLLQHNVLWAAAGTPNAVFSLNSSDIESLTHGKIITIK